MTLRAVEYIITCVAGDNDATIITAGPLMKQFLILAKYSILEIINVLRYDKKRTVFWVLLLMSPLIIIGGAASAVALFKDAAKIVPITPLLNSFALALFVLFGFTASANLFVTMKSVFNSSFIEKLAPLPINNTTLFFAKIFDMIFFNYFDIAFSLPLFFGLAYMLGGGFWIFLAAASLFIAFEMLISFMVLALTLTISRNFSKRSAEFITWCLSVIFVLAFIVVQNYPSKLLNMPQVKLVSFFSIFKSPVFELLPTKWLLGIIHGLSGGNYSSAAYYLLLFVSLTALSYFISYNLFISCFHKGVESEKAAVKSSGAISGRRSFKSLPPIAALFKKEFFGVLRNTQIVYSLLIMPAMFLLLTYMDFSFADMGVFSFLIFTIYATAMNSTLFCFGMEGSAIMIYKSLPVGINKIFWVKYLVYCLFNLAVTSLCLAFALKRSAVPEFIGYKTLVTAFVFAVAWFNLIVADFGFYFANYKSEGKLKNSITMEGTFGLMISVMMFLGAFIYFLYGLNFAAAKALVVLMVSLHGGLHYLALKRYEKGEL